MTLWCVWLRLLDSSCSPTHNAHKHVCMLHRLLLLIIVLGWPHCSLLWHLLGYKHASHVYDLVHKSRFYMSTRAPSSHLFPSPRVKCVYVMFTCCVRAWCALSGCCHASHARGCDTLFSMMPAHSIGTMRCVWWNVTDTCALLMRACELRRNETSHLGPEKMGCYNAHVMMMSCRGLLSCARA